MSLTTLLVALLAGILPSFIWLLFWLREDRLHPEPRWRLFAAFLGGMLAVVVSLPIERFVQTHYALNMFGLIVVWATIEESLKYLAVRITSLKRKFVDEPVDVLIYFITTALGFAALENTFFLLSPLTNGLILESVITGNMRFVGAMLLHVSASGIIGAYLAFSFYKKNKVKAKYLAIGLILSIVLHTIFNVFIMSQTANGSGLLVGAFASVWVVVIALIFIFEKVKRIKPQR